MSLTSPSSVPAENDPCEPRVDDPPIVALGLILLRRLRLLILLPLLVGSVTLGVSFLIPPTFTAVTLLLPPQQQSSAASALLGSLGGVAGALGSGLSGIKNPTEQWIGLLKSRSVADALVTRFKLRELYEADYQFQARDGLAARTAVTSGKDGMIELRVDDRSPQRAAQIAAAYVEELQRLVDTLAVTEAAQRRLFFQKRLDEAKAGLIKAETALRESGVGGDVVKTSPGAAVTQLAQVQAAVAAQEVRISVMRGSMTESNPELRQATLQLASLREQLRKLERDGPAGASGNESTQYVARYREFKYFETLFDLFAKQYEIARVDEARDGGLIQVVDAAQVPEYKSRPKRAMMAALAGMLTFMLCAAYVLGSHYWRRFSRQRAAAFAGNAPQGAVGR